MLSLRELFRRDSDFDPDGVIIPVGFEDPRPVKIFRAILFWISAFIITLLVICSVTPIRELAVAIGEVIPDGNVIQMQHLEGGIVSEIYVKNGQIVEKGDPIIRLEPTAASSELGQYEQRKASFTIKQMRLKALINGTEFNPSEFAKSHPNFVRENLNSYNYDKETINNTKEALISRLEQKQSDLQSLQNEIANTQTQIEISEEQYRLKEALAEKGYAPKVAALDAKSIMLTAKSKLNQLEGAILTTQKAIQEAQSLLEQSQNNFLRERSEELNKITSDLAELEEAINKQSDKFDRTYLRSPVRGVIMNMLPRAVGQVIKPSESVVAIVPSDTPLLAEVNLKPDDVGHVVTGQLANLRITTFDPEVYGDIKGLVQWISASTFETPKGEKFYKAVILIDRKNVHHNADVRPLLPGMIVQADIITGSKSLMRYMLKPIARSVDAAFSER